MLILLSKIDGAQYGIDTRQIVEIIPYIDLNKVTQSPDHIAGVINFRGRAIIVIDMPMLLAGRRANKILSTRIAIIKSTNNSASITAGLLLEHATDVLRVKHEDYLLSGIADGSTQNICNYMLKNGEMVQCLNPEKILQENDDYMHVE